MTEGPSARDPNGWSAEVTEPKEPPRERATLAATGRTRGLRRSPPWRAARGCRS